ncbi:MAG: hypothetical protein Fur0032_11720 [Terrimicrobiaceae bacterium]
MKWVIFLFALSFGSAFAQAPSLVTYQGRLVGPDGVVISDGTRALTFRLFDAPTGGNLIWARKYDVPVTDGRFSVVLGAPGEPVASDPAPAVNDLAYAFAGEDRFLEISVDDGSPLLPRQQMGSVPYAIKALHGVPAGTVVAFAGTVAPVGWLHCDGGEHLKADYPTLSAVIANVYGTASSPDKFRVPDLRGRTVIGVGKGDAPIVGGIEPANWLLGLKFGAERHLLSLAEMPKHNHNVRDLGHDHPTSPDRFAPHSNSGSGYDDASSGGARRTGTGHANIAQDDRGGDQPHNNMQPSLVLNYIIKL